MQQSIEGTGRQSPHLEEGPMRTKTLLDRDQLLRPGTGGSHAGQGSYLMS